MPFTITKELLDELRKRLNTGNMRGVHLNAIPGRSKYKFDLYKLARINKSIPNDFIEGLLSPNALNFRVSFSNMEENINKLSLEERIKLLDIGKYFNNLITESESRKSEKGINTLGFGFPILTCKNNQDDRLIIAPIFIWEIEIRRLNTTNTWRIKRSVDSPVYVNEVLINHIKSDRGVEIRQIPEDETIDRNKLISTCIDIINRINPTNGNNNLRNAFFARINDITNIKDKKHYESINEPFVEFAGIFSIFEVQKQNVINEYDTLLKSLNGLQIETDDMVNESFESISQVETDPSQQGVLNSLSVKRNVLIQGPPGTGKSQTLAAILINALANKKKVIVVCEKRTALDVLYNALTRRYLGQYCALIKDVKKDRKDIVNSVRDRTDRDRTDNQRPNRNNTSATSWCNFIEQIKKQITDINTRHKEISKTIIEDKNITYIIGYLLNLMRESRFKFDDMPYIYIDEGIIRNKFTNISAIKGFVNTLKTLQDYYKKFQNVENSCIKPQFFFSGSTLKKLQSDIKQNLKSYRIELENTDKLYRGYKEKKNKFLYIKNFVHVAGKKAYQRSLKEFALVAESIQDIAIRIHDEENKLPDITKRCKEMYCKFRKNEIQEQINNINEITQKADKLLNNRELHTIDIDKKVNSAFYKFLSNFSKSKKQTILDYWELQEFLKDLQQRVQENSDIRIINAFKIHKHLTGSIDELRNLKRNIQKLNNGLESIVILEFDKFNISSVHLSQQSMNSINQKIAQYKNTSVTVYNEMGNLLNGFLSRCSSLYKELNSKVLQLQDFNSTEISNSGDISTLLKDIERHQQEIQKNIQVKEATIKEIEAEFSKDTPIKECKKEWDELVEHVGLLYKTMRDCPWIDDIHFGNLNDIYGFISYVESKLNSVQEYMNKSDLLSWEYGWYNQYGNLSEDDKNIVDELKKLDNNYEWNKIFPAFLYNWLLENSDVDTDLAKIEEDSYEKMDKWLIDIAKKQKACIDEYWINQRREANVHFIGQHGGTRIDALYNLRGAHGQHRNPLRQIVKSDTDLFTSFFPIILTSPDVACNLFKENYYFDIVMFDEASQLRLEDNLPAMLKGKQIIVSGDEHQMPPANYFRKQNNNTNVGTDDGDDDENADDVDAISIGGLIDCVSLLDFASQLNFEQISLEYHYRSRHPYLIDFSNHAFYGGKLKPLPNVNDYVPITYVPVNGIYADKVNEREADAVISILKNNINKNSEGNYPSVGIATFNIFQRNLINSKIAEMQEKDKGFNEKIGKLQESDTDGLFIKNLENIQGDERDVIIISTTFGCNYDGQFFQRFGPLLKNTGYKLLNVIITRAKYKVYVCTSIPENPIIQYNTYLANEGNNKKAILYAYLAYCKAVSEKNNDARNAILTALNPKSSNNGANLSIFNGQTESPFEEEVYQCLCEKFDKNRLELQSKVANYRIDIVYKSNKANVPLIAIECDGAAYHSSEEAYLYDKYRQKVLEDHGFVFHRIWSTDWWYDEVSEVNKLVKFIKDIEEGSKTINAPSENLSKTFTENVVIESEPDLFNNVNDNNVKVEIMSEDAEDQEEVEDAIENMDNEPEPQTGVQKNSIVKIQYIESGKEITLQLYSSPSVPQLEGAQKMDYRKPVAEALIGHEVGEIVPIKLQDPATHKTIENKVKILEIR